MTDLPEPDPIRADRRRARRRASLAVDAACLLCGVRDIDALLPAGRSLLEDHHVLGRAAAPELTVVLCRNCHAIQTARQHDHGALPPLGKGVASDSVLERVARGLISLSVFLHELAHTLQLLASQVLVFVRQLDGAVPGWRDWESAR
jgi:hypothetical protein